ncbi:SDR family NAD(P)-dependent oxidoreductase [Candidatus Bathyarchaeota archaeon]|nr:SDR family NAD(P)-dependent oxidoreductase [Candidatus Bathyarchaeota archaeon]
MSSRTDSCAVIIGSGPGIGAHTAAIFAANRFNKVALVARNPVQLEKDAATVSNAAAPAKVEVRTYSTDASDHVKLAKTLEQISEDLGTAEFVLYNAAVVAQSTLLESCEEDMLRDFRISTIGLHVTAKWAMPQLISIADPAAKPTLMVTSSHLPEEPEAAVFSLSLAKAAQKNLVRSLRQKFGAEEGAHVCLLTVAGYVDETRRLLNSTNIANEAWRLYSQPKDAWTEDVRIEE